MLVPVEKLWFPPSMLLGSSCIHSTNRYQCILYARSAWRNTPAIKTNNMELMSYCWETYTELEKICILLNRM
jgi:hypothetical protein